MNDYILNFCNYLLIEKKYSSNTIESYKRDLTKFFTFLNKDNLDITKDDIHRYLKYLSEEHMNEKSISRNISCLKSFYKFLLIEKEIKENPMDEIEIPKLRKSLPKSLTEEEINLLLEIPLVDDFSYRNKAMLELLYATGMRVSELINLTLLGAGKIDNFDINQNAYFITQLKLAALQALSYEEFLEFFCLYQKQELSNVGITPVQRRIGENELAFSFKTYLKLKPYLDETSAFFWNLLYEDFQFDGKKLASSKLFYDGNRESAIKNNYYLNSEEIDALNKIVTAYLDIAEVRALAQEPMYMKDWLETIDDYLKMTRRDILVTKGKVTHKQAIEKAHKEYEKYVSKYDEQISPVEKHFIESISELEGLL